MSQKRKNVQRSILDMFSNSKRSHPDPDPSNQEDDPQSAEAVGVEPPSTVQESVTEDPGPCAPSTSEPVKPRQPAPERGKNFQFSKWKKTYPWLVNHDGKYVTCRECTTAHGLGLLSGEPHLDLAFISRGFKSWKKVPAGFSQHARSRSHLRAVEALIGRGRENPTQVQVLSGHAKAVDEARTALDAIFDAIEYLARQCLPLRNRDKGSSNLQALLTTMAKKNPALEKWLRRDTQMYLSPQIQNEILELMAHTILKQTATEVGAAEAFAIIVDESTDVSRQEQVSLCARFVDPGCEVQEVFLGFYSTDSTTADTLARLILDALQRLNLPIEKLRGQCYDGASNMAGRISGVQVRIKEKQPKALFIHCTAHRLNLATLTAATPALRNALGEASGLIEFVRSSPKRLAMFEQHQEDTAAGLTSFCRTRWTCNERSLTSLLSNWAAVLATLHAIEEDPTASPESAAKAHGYRRAMEEFDFFFMASLGLRVYQLVTPVITAIQSRQESVTGVLSKVRLMREAVLSQCSEAVCDRFWSDAVAKADSLGVDEPRLRRPVKKPQRLRDNDDEEAPPKTPKERYSREYDGALRSLAASIKDRFTKGDDQVLQGVEAALAGNQDEGRRAARFYGLDEERVVLHLRFLHDAGRRPKSLQDAAEMISELQDLVPEAARLVRLALTAPATSCSAERSFSLMRRLKTYMRATMGQARFNHLAVCAAYGRELGALDRKELLREFVGRSAQRRHAFGLI